MIPRFPANQAHATSAVPITSNRIIYEIENPEQLVIVYRIEHRATAYRPR